MKVRSESKSKQSVTSKPSISNQISSVSKQFKYIKHLVDIISVWQNAKHGP